MNFKFIGCVFNEAMIIIFRLLPLIFRDLQLASRTRQQLIRGNKLIRALPLQADVRVGKRSFYPTGTEFVLIVRPKRAE